MDTFFGLIIWGLIGYYFYKRHQKKKAARLNDEILPKTISTPKVSELNTQTDSFAIQKVKIPDDIVSLLWFSNGTYKNYDPDADKQTMQTNHGINLQFHVSGDLEPSYIDIDLPIRKPENLLFVEPLPYFPRYNGMNSEQRWIYLNWLQDIDKPVAVGYVFVFFYGLERHLYSSMPDAAFDMVLRLAKHHKNSSFQSYATNSLLGCMLFHKRVDLFDKYIRNVDNIMVSELYMYVKYLLNQPIFPEEIIGFASKLGFSNKRYINSEYALFLSILTEELKEQTGNDFLSWDKFDPNKCQTTTTPVAANTSLSPSQINIPDVMSNTDYAAFMLNLLKTTHEKVKLALKEQRKTK